METHENIKFGELIWRILQRLLKENWNAESFHRSMLFARLLGERLNEPSVCKLNSSLMLKRSKQKTSENSGMLSLAMRIASKLRCLIALQFKAYNGKLHNKDSLETFPLEEKLLLAPVWSKSNWISITNLYSGKAFLLFTFFRLACFVL